MDSSTSSNLAFQSRQSPVPLKNSNNGRFLNTASMLTARRTSRVYPAGFDAFKPRLITETNTPTDQIEKTSQVYQASQCGSYFKKCFKTIRSLGKGVFGEAVEVESLEDRKRYSIKRALRKVESSGDRQIKIREALVHESTAHHENTLRYVKAWEEK